MHASMRRTVLAVASLFALAAVSVGCSGATPRLVPLLRTAGIPIVATPTDAVPLEVVSRATVVPDPLPVQGSDFVYGEVEAALGMAVTSATAPWAASHRDYPVAHHGGWTVLVEVVAADAKLEAGGRVVVSMDVRATLRTRNGNVYLGQTQIGCHEGGLRSADEGAPIFYRCMTRIGRDLAGWLGGGVLLDPPPEPG
jgi:hypothetical protein